jgi:putative ABC transport system ATP-binding protein
VAIAGVALAGQGDDALARLRREHLGFVFQAFHVLPHLTVAENVSLPLRLLGRNDDARVQAMLDAVGLAGLEARLPAQLSGGQLQRVAIARAVVHAPGLILADEPTGNLDPSTAERVLGMLRTQVRDAGAACLLVTHSAAAATHADRVLRLTAQGIVKVMR